MTAMTFESTTNPAATDRKISTKRMWTGYLMSGPAALFLLVDAVGKLVKPAPVVQATLQLGYPDSCIVGLGIVLLVCTALYLIPRTALLGAVLSTGYLGGAVATHVRVSASWFNVLFPVFLGFLLWTGLALRNDRVANLFGRDMR